MASEKNKRRAAASKTRSLPVVSGPKIKRSRAGYWRAGVLILVHLLAAIHIAHWMSTGRTVTPVEPSEAMEFSKEGIVNAGLIFFVLAILSTLILGRWFCGWACHLVALQDLARWLLGLIRVRPKPIRSRVLGLIPLLAFLYMFIAPWLGSAADSVASFLTGQPPLGLHSWTQTTTKLTTTGFRDTFPGLLSAILTFVTCGFLIIYVLGAKGFCFTGCPYGAIFGVADRFAPLRIRVTDDCTQSGHCTAVCSSNVRVHEEVRDFRMVVDSGCMKCLDCVNVCPNEALYVGWGKPVAIGAPTLRNPTAGPTGKAKSTLPVAAQWALLAIFAFLALLVFHGFDLPYRFRPHPVGVVQCGMLTLIALGVAALFRAPRHAPRGCSLAEELMLAVFFLVSMVTFRGPPLVPFLFSLGLSAISAYLLTQACLLLGRRQLSFQGWRLKRDGDFQPAAVGFAAVLAGLLTLGTFAGLAQASAIRARDADARLAELMPAVAREPGDPAALEEAIRLNRDLVRRSPSGSRLFTWGKLLCQRQRFDDVRLLCEEAIRQDPRDAVAVYLLGILETLRPDPGSDERALRRFGEAARLDREWPEARRTLAHAYLLSNRLPDAIRELESAVRDVPADADVHFMLASLLMQSGDVRRARENLERAASIAPQRDDIRAALNAAKSR
jgi:tetratricopeptide (TPR) repeat protein/ferredoxin